MSKKKGKKTYQNTPWEDNPKLGKMVTLKGLPSPEDIAAAIADNHRKVTLSLDEETIAFFKQQAEAFNVPYQKMIRNVLDAYCKQYR